MNSYNLGGGSSDGGGGGNCFTISGLNLNLGGGGATTSQPILRPMQPPPLPQVMNQQDMSSNDAVLISTDEAGYAANTNISGNTMNKFMAIENCTDLENYWAPY